MKRKKIKPCFGCGDSFVPSYRNRSHCSQACRFWSKVRTAGHSECWTWTSSRHYAGYGEIWWDGKRRKAHRIAWQLTYGLVPDGMLVCHHCDNPPCCNPAHLFLGTNAANMADRNNKGRARGGGSQGESHPNAKLTESNVRAIRAEYLSGGISQEDLGERFGVSRPAISLVLHGKRWRHVS